MMSAMKWFLMAGGAVGLGATWGWMKAQAQQSAENISVPAGAKVFAGAATGMGLIELLRQSVFIWVALSVGTIIWGLDVSIPAAKKFLGHYPQLYFIVPYFVGAGCSGLSSGQIVKQVVGGALVVCGLGILLHSFVQYSDWQLAFTINVPANSKSSEFTVEAGDKAFWDVEDAKRIALFDVATQEWLFQCTNEPWSSIVAPTRRQFYFHSCKPSASTIRVKITH